MNLKYNLSIALLLLSNHLFPQSDNAVQGEKTNSTFFVNTIGEFNSAMQKATAGSTIILKNGNWTDVELHAFGKGISSLPISVRAETAGDVILTGNSKLTISGTYVIVSGLWFKDGNPTGKEVVSFRKSSTEIANNCRLTNCVISNYNPLDKSIESHWVDMWGKNNRVDHNNFTGKTNGGTTLVVWLKGEEHTENHHQIDHNFFGKRPFLGVNGGESIRIGTSENSMKSSKTIVEFNTFKHCNGEIEIISNKSADNIFRDNLFIESEGCLTLRHGDRALVENNVFIGNNKPNTGGIRVINAGHVIRNNFLISLAGDDYRGPIVLMNGVPNSPLNRYNQVKNVDIQNNTIINCGPIVIGAGKDKEKSLAPITTVFANNLVSNTTGKEIIQINDNSQQVTFLDNITDTEAQVNPAFFTKSQINWTLLNSLPMPTSDNEILKSVKRNDKSPKLDITKTERSIYVAGAFNLSNTLLPEIIRTKTGPSWNPIITDPELRLQAIVVKVEPGIGTLSNAIKKATSGNTLLLAPGIYYVEKTLKIDGQITIQGNGKPGESIIKTAEGLSKPLTSLFRANEGSRLALKNVCLDGTSPTFVKYAVVSPEEKKSGLYSLFIDNSIFQNFKNKDGGSIFKAYVGTLADTISITNSKFEESYRGLNLSYQKDETGKYNAEVIILFNSVFKNIEEFAINYFRSGTNTSNKGGQLLINQCVFSRVFNLEGKKMISTNGIKKVEIRNSVFENSINVKNPVSLSGAENSIENCLFFDCGFLKVSKNATEKNIQYKNPKWDDSKNFVPSKKSPLLEENNKIGRIGLLNTLKTE